ncbi:MAG: TldD/PmbA family protein [Candidatus Heimdallarchaeota archaeon]|nr:TldD/PmbA family protein [Candidatus Heimdallarchaeota archaeon]
MTSKEDLHELAEFIIKQGLKLGADQVEAYTLYGSAKSVQVERGSIRKFTDISNSGLGIRIIKDKSIGMASTTIFTKDSIENCVNNAYALAKVSPPDPNFDSLPVDETPTPEIQDRYDQSVIDLDVEEFTEIILQSIQEAQKYEKAIIGGNFTAGYGERFIVNSQGIDRTSSQTSVSGYLSVKLEEGEDIGNAYYYDASTVLSKFKYEQIGKVAGERAKNMLGSKKIETTSLPILLDPDSTYGTIEPILSNGINAFSVFNRTAFFVDKIGDAIANEKLNITDDPFYPGGTDSAPFDDEGVVPKKLKLVENGILQTYITDSYSAPLVGLENTGHASRGSFASRPRPAPYTLSIEPGTISKDNLIADMKEGILMIGSPLHSRGNNPQISAQINQGFLVKDGEIQYPIKNAVIGCTVFDVYQKIDKLSKEIENRNGHKAPWMLLKALQVSGGK